MRTIRHLTFLAGGGGPGRQRWAAQAPVTAADLARLDETAAEDPPRGGRASRD